MTRAGRPAVVLLATLAAIVLVVLGLGWLLTHPLASSVGHRDDDVARWLAAHRTPGLSRAADLATYPGETRVGGPALVVVGALVAALVRSWRPLLLTVVTALGTGVVYYSVTHVVHRDRPPVPILDPGLVPDHSFPSGHTGTATALALGTALLLVTYGLVRPRPVRLLVLGLLALVPLLVLASRLYQGAHHLTDVLTSLVYATVWVTAVGRQVLPARVAGALSPARGPG
ncbi:MAG: phosphoesterase, PA-phosphatase related protein [Marmoricola sp.]|nr:phosphoesterase, PA-phosphatase related protein [Marmoricola sp.]